MRGAGIPACAGLVVLLAACSGSGPERSSPPPLHSSSSPPTAREQAVAPAGSIFTPAELDLIFTFSPLPAPPPDPTNRVADDAAAARFGQMLFFDTRLSGKGDVSCASCHIPEKSFSDGLPIPEKFSKDLRHVPSLWNVAYNRWFFWDGRSDSLWSQALDPLENPTEHAGFRGSYARLMFDDPATRREYEAVFGPLPDMSDLVRFPAKYTQGAAPAGSEDDRNEINRVFANLGKALAAYQRKIVSRRAPFDIFVEGLKTRDASKLSALSPSAQRGLKLFIGQANCRSCHHGPNFTDGEFHDTGVAALDPADRPDLGRFQGINKLLGSPFNATGPYSDDQAGRATHPTSFLVNRVDWRGQFKTPSLRNVALTAPYMHRGQMRTLPDVVEFYSTMRLPGETSAEALAREVRTRRARTDAGHSHGGGEHVLTALNLSRSEMDDLIAFLESLTDTGIDPSLTRPISR